MISAKSKFKVSFQGFFNIQDKRTSGFINFFIVVRVNSSWPLRRYLVLSIRVLCGQEKKLLLFFEFTEQTFSIAKCICSWNKSWWCLPS